MSEGAAAEGGKILGVRWQKNWGWVAKFLGGMAKDFGVEKQIKFCHPTLSQIYLPVNEITQTFVNYSCYSSS